MGATALGKYLRNAKTIEKLIIENCQINDSSLKMLFQSWLALNKVEAEVVEEKVHIGLKNQNYEKYIQ